LSEQRELARLVKRARKGDAKAFGEIYDRYHEQIYVYVLHQVGTPADAEDITAGVFLDVLEKIEGFTWQGSGFAAWLFRIARNDVLDFFRRRGRKSREITLTDEILELPARETVEGQAETAADERELLAAIGKLSEDQQQVVLLKLLANLSNRQVGEVMSKGEGAVKALQHRALITLRKFLEEERRKDQ
jgi:RNA polymerase sigma-70 factor (ECF subfamily)